MNGTLASLDYAKPLQVDAELAELTGLLVEIGVSSYLEIGARYGGSFEAILTALGPMARGVAVDFPGGNFGDEESAPILLAAIDRLRKRHARAGAIFGPSTAPEVVERVEALAPFDVVLIDADHSYEAVRRDFETYLPMARKAIVLHDIAAPKGTHSKTGKPVEVPRFWDDIGFAYSDRQEIVAPGSNMGFGVVWL